MNPEEAKLSRSEALILSALVGSEPERIAFDWLVVQHLKQRGLLEDTAAGPKVTAKGKQAIHDHQVSSD